MMISAKMIKSRLTLAWALVKHVFFSFLPFVKRPPPRVWLERLAEESLAPTPVEAWSYMEATSRCIGCGLCDVAGKNGETPSEWILGAARQAEDAPLVLDEAHRLKELAESIAKICPVQVPAEGIARLIVENNAMLESVKPSDN